MYSKTWVSGREKIEDIVSRFEFDTIHECDRQTDGHRPTAKSVENTFLWINDAKNDADFSQ